MYETFFGLRERPFELTPNPRFLFLTPKHREALATLRYGLSSPRGLTVLVGEAGSGKTTLLRAVLADDTPAHSRHVLVSNPTLTRSEFYELLTEGFRLPAAAAASKARFLTEFQRDVEQRHSVGGLSAIVLDEAQSLPYELMEEVRLLANLETVTSKLLNVVLAGQPELADRLNEPSLRQLKQRISLRCTLGSLDLRETASYIAARVRTAGGDPTTLFTKDAILAVYEASHGLPRTISVVCDNALLGAFAAETRPVNVDIVQEVCRDFDLNGSRSAAAERMHSAAAASMVPGHFAPSVPVRVEPEPAPPADPAERDSSGRPPLFGEFGKKKRFSFF